MADELDSSLKHYSMSCRKCGNPISYDGASNGPDGNDVVICPNCNAANIHSADLYPADTRGTE